MIDRWIAEATECDFKVALEVKKPKSWLKSVSAFANGIGGTLFFGIDDGRNVIGLSDAQTNAETISRLIKERITPYPSFVLAPERESGKDILVLSVSSGRSTPYYYKADGIMEAYIRMGNESVIAPSYVLNQLILKGMHRTYDELISEYDFKDYAFSKLRERYKAWTGNSMEEKLFDSFDMRDENGKLTNFNLDGTHTYSFVKQDGHWYLKIDSHLFTGRAFDRVGPHPVMVPAFVSFALGMVVLAFAANDWMILGAAALLGFGVGTVQSCGLAMAVRVTSDARLSVANATFYMLLDVGVGVGPILLGIVAPLIGYANLYLCMAVVGALALALFLVVAKTEKGAR